MTQVQKQLKFDPRRSTIDALLHAEWPQAEAEWRHGVNRQLERPRDLESLRAITALLPPIGGMRYDHDSLVRRSRQRMQVAQTVAARIGRGYFQRVVDIGCGRGDNMLGLAAESDVLYTGLDINSRLFPSQKEWPSWVRFLKASAEDIPVTTGSVDLVVSFNVLEHLPDPQRALLEFARILRPGGVFFTQFGPPWNSPFGPHLTRLTGLPHLHHLFEDTVVSQFTGRPDPYHTVNRHSLTLYRHALWYTPGLICNHYSEYVTLVHDWLWPRFLPQHASMPLEERVVNRIDAGLVRA